MATTPVSLKALAEAKVEGVQKATYFKVAPGKVKFEPGFNLREEGPELDEHLERLYQAMKAGAYIPPIDVAIVDGEIIARDGHCRTRCAQRLVDEGTDYQLEARQLRGNESDAVYHMLGTGNGKAYSPLEQGRGFLRLMNYGADVAAIATRLGLHRSTIENGLALAGAPVAVQQMVASGKVASHLALKTVRQHGSKAAEKLKAAIDTAAAAGKTKATAKHLAAKGPRERGQTLPPTQGIYLIEDGQVPAAKWAGPDPHALFNLVMRLAAVNTIVSNLDRAAITAIVQDARALVGPAS